MMNTDLKPRAQGGAAGVASHQAGLAEARATDAQRLAVTPDRLEELLQPLQADNWMQMRADLVGNQPNLSKAYAAVDFALPRKPMQQGRVGDFRVKIHDDEQPFCPLKVHLAFDPQNEPVPTSRAPNLISRLGRTFVRASSSRIAAPVSGNAPPRFYEPQSQRTEVIHKILKGTLESQINTPSGNLVRSANNQLDLSGDLLSAVAQKCGYEPRAEYPAEVWCERVAQALLFTPGDPESEFDDFSDAQLQAIRALPLAEIELLHVLDYLTYLSDSRDQRQKMYPILSDDRFSVVNNSVDYEDQSDPSKYYQNTLCPGVKRLVADKRWLNSAHGAFTNWVVSPGEQVRDKPSLISGLAGRAHCQVSAVSFEFSALMGELLPQPVYQIISQIEQKPTPAHISEGLHEWERSVGIAQEVRAEEQSREQARQQREQLARQEATEQSRALTAQINADRSSQLGVKNNSKHIRLASGGSSTAIANRSFDYRLMLNVDSSGLYPLLSSQFVEMNMAHNARGQEAVFRTQQGGAGFNRDNRCWLRAAWLSVFEQANAGQLMAAVDEAQIGRANGQTRPSASSNAMKFELAALRLAYGKSPLNFLHYGEESRLADSPAHFRTGQKFNDCLDAYQVTRPSEVRPDLYSATRPTLTVETILKDACFALVPGIRATMDEAVALSSPLSIAQATSDIPAAMHRALGIPAVIVENSGTGQLSVRVVGPNSHSLASLENEIESANTSSDAARVLVHQLLERVDFPIIHLQGTRFQDGHYTVYLPRSGELGQSLVQAVEQKARVDAQRVSGSAAVQGASIWVGEGFPHDEVEVQASAPWATRSLGLNPPTTMTRDFIPSQAEQLRMGAPSSTREALEMMQFAINHNPSRPLVVELLPAHLKQGMRSVSQLLRLGRFSSLRSLSVGRTEAAITADGWNKGVKLPASTSIRISTDGQPAGVQLIQGRLPSSARPLRLAESVLALVTATLPDSPNEPSGSVLVSHVGSNYVGLFSAVSSYVEQVRAWAGADRFAQSDAREQLLNQVIQESIGDQADSGDLRRDQAEIAVRHAVRLYHDRENTERELI